ncbi:hypothetical protein [Streptomyces sp. NPDC056188]|uniref:hypothetical protein n=1 Tax=Streptomyces sp. NPDC056188 TaxID=3345740 RepID=UPI0035DBF44E
MRPSMGAAGMHVTRVGSSPMTGIIAGGVPAATKAWPPVKLLPHTPMRSGSTSGRFWA